MNDRHLRGCYVDLPTSGRGTTKRYGIAADNGHTPGCPDDGLSTLPRATGGREGVGVDARKPR
jgi:hypothetical protein